MQITDRLHALDAVRAYALLLGVVLHSAVPFLANVEVPMWRDEPHAGAAGIYFVIHMFRMSAFFLMAGFFGRTLVERRGMTGFVKDRLKRVAVPLFLFGPIALLLALGGWALGALPHGGQTLSSALEEAAAAPQGERAGRVDIAHLWFLYYLLIFYALALAVRAAVRAVDPKGSMRTAGDRVVAFVVRGIWAPALIALPIAAYLWQQPNWNEWDLPVALLPMSSAALIMIGGSMLLLLPSYHYLVRFTWIGAILNGRRHTDPAKAPPADAAPAVS